MAESHWIAAEPRLHGRGGLDVRGYQGSGKKVCSQ